MNQMTNYNALNVFIHRHFILKFLHFNKTEIWFSSVHNTWALSRIFGRSGRDHHDGFYGYAGQPQADMGMIQKPQLESEHILRFWFNQVIFGSQNV